MLSHLPLAAKALGARLVRAAALAGLVSMTGCASYYVDTATKEVPVSQYKVPAPKAPVQMLFEFQTKGVANSRATDMLKTQVVEQVRTSGLFSDVSELPVQGGAVLSITLNNVPLTDNAFGKGFVTGLTFGLAGQQVTDGYICTAKFLDEKHKEPLTVTVRHAIHTVVGAKGAPGNAVAAPDIGTAVRTMTKQAVSTALSDVSQSL